MDVMIEISRVQFALAELGISIAPKGEKDSHFQKYLRNLFSSQLETNFPLGDVERELRRMWALIGQLKNIQRARPDVFKKCIENLNKHTSEENFWGYRFEVHIADLLVQKQIRFMYRDRPDFSLKHKNTEIHIECGSARTSQTADAARLRRKLFGHNGTINKKSAKPYMNFKTALFLDVTNLIFNAIINDAALEMSELEQETTELINQTKCGAIALVLIGQNKETGRVGYLAVPICHENIDENLRDFLALHIPRVDERILNISVFRDT
jgi:hypothetical protein